ncbi:MAG TPA: hypothetical protein VJL28_02120 [Gemmatimonadaceae bacterium]|nr:hypothetical protein [Gemmatimonadaceae bacterium]
MKTAAKRKLYVQQRSREDLAALVADENPDALLADGFEDAFIGLARRCGQPTLVTYDTDKCLEILIARDGMTYEEAVEYFEFNVVGAWMGPNTPLYLYRHVEED